MTAPLVSPLFSVCRVTTEADRQAALVIRFTVFVDEQGVSAEAETDEYDDTSTHWLACGNDGHPIATARLREKGNGIGKVERVAVLIHWRGSGVGRAILEAIAAEARALGITQLILHAQVSGRGFYEKLGYTVPVERIFDEEGIDHILMVKTIE